MASPLLMIASREPTTTTTTTTTRDQETRTEKTRGKKAAKSKSKSPAKKKQPQRGMGVEQLERLRVQEAWKKLVEKGPVHQISQPFAPPSFGSPLICNGGNGSGSNHGMMGFNGGSGYASGSGGAGYDRGWDPRFGRNVILESSFKELSSIPNMQCGFDFEPFGVHFKKKRTNNDSPAFMESSSSMMNRSKFIGMDLATSANFIEDNQNIRNFNNARVPIKEVEIKAVHRNENLEGGGGILMEYDFLPSNNKSSLNCPNDEDIGFGPNNDTPIDLSLKL